MTYKAAAGSGKYRPVKQILCDEPGCNKLATYEVEWQDGDGFASVKLCDEHFPTDPNVTNVFCSIKKL